MFALPAANSIRAIGETRRSQPSGWPALRLCPGVCDGRIEQDRDFPGARSNGGFDKLIARRGYKNRSEALRGLIREALMSKVIDSNKPVTGTLTLVYDHQVPNLSQKLTEMQHHGGNDRIGRNPRASRPSLLSGSRDHEGARMKSRNWLIACWPCADWNLASLSSQTQGPHSRRPGSMKLELVLP